MTSSNCVRSRGVTRSSGSRGVFSFSAGRSPLGARSPLGTRSGLSPLPPSPLACWPLSPFGACSPFGGRGAFSGFFPSSCSLSAIDLCSRALGDAHALPVGALAYELEPDPGGLAVLRVGQCQVGEVDRQLLGDDAALLLRGLLLVALDHVDAAYERALDARTHLDHLAAAALVAAGQHDHLVTLPDFRRHHSTSGASEMIFMWFLARNSRGTGPKMRVPTGSICGFISTAALRSKRMTEPSGRRISLRMRTTTAFITSPFLTRPRGIASLTETTITSPTVAYLRLEPPSTLMHITRRAPELSATSRLVCIWIMRRLAFRPRRAYCALDFDFGFFSDSDSIGASVLDRFSPAITSQRLSLEIEIGRASCRERVW